MSHNYYSFQVGQWDILLCEQKKKRFVYNTIMMGLLGIKKMYPAIFSGVKKFYFVVFFCIETVTTSWHATYTYVNA